MKGDLGSYPNFTLDDGIEPPVSCIVGNDIKVCDLIKCFLWFYFPKAKIIFDPTCGEENFQFSPWIYSNPQYVYIAADIKKTRHNKIVADVFHTPLRDKSVDVVVYDPPYVPNTRLDKRGKLYGTYSARSVVTIFNYFNETVFKEFYRITKQGIIVKCSDFYYPRSSNNLYLILPYITQQIEKFFKIVALHVYRYFYEMIPLYRHRIRHICKKNRRAIINHTYYIIAYKK